MTTIYFAGGEDSDFFQVGGGTLTTSGAGGQYRTAFARCALNVNGLNNGSINLRYWQNQLPFISTPTQLWASARLFSLTIAPGAIGTFQPLIRFCDGTGLPRLQIIPLNTNSHPTMGVQKVNTAGVATTLTNSLSDWNLSPSGSSTDKIDIFINNAVSGTINIYFTPSGGSPTLVYSFTGDTTTEVTTLAYIQLFWIGGSSSSGIWSEIIVCDSDTRNMSLQTLAPVANGNTHNFDTGSPAAANVNEVTLNDATLDGSTTAGQIDQYTIPSLASGTWSIIAVGMSARMQKGSSGPSKMDLGVRNAGGDFWSADQILTTTFFDYQNWWTTDPNTGVAWATLPTNIGLKSVT